ncbi:MAG: M1 family metallopeptidase [Planctomycetota bacterium]
MVRSSGSVALVLWLFASAALVGCASTSEPDPAAVAAAAEAERAKAEALEMERVVKELMIEAKKAALEAESERAAAKAAAAKKPTADLFRPLDWPAPNEARLVTGAPGPGIWNQRADYEIAARLDTETDTVFADLTLTYTNNSPHELDQLWFNLDQNLFRSDSKGSKSRPGGSRFVVVGGFEGGYTFNGVRVDGVSAELSVFDTVGRIALDEPVAALGGEVVVELSYELPVPPEGRQGIFESDAGKVYELAHWFPNVCVYDDVEGWNTLPHLGPGEFYTDFGDYRVSITVPRSHIVAATGTIKNAAAVLTPEQFERLENGALESEETVVIRSLEEVRSGAGRPEGEGELTWTFVASDVRTFAWSSSAAFVWDAAVADLDGREVLCQSFYPPEGVGSWAASERAGGSTQYLRHAINYYSEWLGEYPYDQISNVSGREYGMEYPMIVFCDARPDPSRPIEQTDRSLFGVTDHEVGHQWFPMLVSSNERRYAWQDEGLNTFTDGYSYESFWGEPEFAGAEAWMARNMLGRRAQPIMTEPDRIGGRGLGFLGYSKPGFGLRLLRDYILGETVEESRARFDVAMRAYVRRWSFQHPMPWDFFRTVEDVTGEDLSWFWRGWFYQTAVLDQAVEGVVFENDDSVAEVTIAHREGLVMPATWEASFDDGSTQRGRVPAEAWATGDDALVLLDVEGRGLVSFELDPDGVLPDVDRSNDRWGE